MIRRAVLFLQEWFPIWKKKASPRETREKKRTCTEKKKERYILVAQQRLQVIEVVKKFTIVDRYLRAQRPNTLRGILAYALNSKLFCMSRPLKKQY
jgi:hypothetical protein